jgi:Holliday junction resolvase
MGGTVLAMLEFSQTFCNGVEVIAWKIVQENAHFWLWLLVFHAITVDGVDHS